MQGDIRLMPGDNREIFRVSAYTEDTLVQQTTADYLEQQLQWESVYAYNNEDFGPGSFLGGGTARRLFEVKKAAVSRYLKNIYVGGELEQEAYCFQNGNSSERRRSYRHWSG